MIGLGLIEFGFNLQGGKEVVKCRFVNLDLELRGAIQSCTTLYFSSPRDEESHEMDDNCNTHMQKSRQEEWMSE